MSLKAEIISSDCNKLFAISNMLQNNEIIIDISNIDQDSICQIGCESDCSFDYEGLNYTIKSLDIMELFGYETIVIIKK